MSETLSQSDRSFMRRFTVMIVLLAVTSLILLLVASMIYHYAPDDIDPTSAQRTSALLAPPGAVATGEAAAAAAVAAAPEPEVPAGAYGGTTDGKEVYDHLCQTCHTPGIAGAPKTGDSAAWAPRVAEGIDTLVAHAIDGYTGPDGFFMPPKGGNPALTDEQVANAVHWIVEQVQ